MQRQVKKTESSEYDDFFVNGHVIERKVKANDKPLDEHDQQKETERVTKLVEKAEKDAARISRLRDRAISISRLLDIMDVSNERRELYRDDPTIVFDFVGRKDAKTHGHGRRRFKEAGRNDLDRRGGPAGCAPRSEVRRQLPHGWRNPGHGSERLEFSLRPG